MHIDNVKSLILSKFAYTKFSEKLEHPFPIIYVLKPCAAFPLSERWLFCFRVSRKNFFQLFLKNTLPKPTPYSEYVKGLIPDSVQEPLRDP